MKFLKNLFSSWKHSSYRFKTGFNNKFTMVFNYLWAFLKLVFGFFLHSVFFYVSGLFSVTIGLGKFFFFKGEAKSKKQIDEMKYYRLIALAVFLSGCIYYTYIVLLYISDYSRIYHEIIAISLACVSFCEIFFSIRGLIKSKKTNDLLMSGLKCVNLSTALSSLVLTQTALLSFTLEDGSLAVRYSAGTGIIVGFIVSLVGLFMLFRSIKFSQKFYILKKRANFKRTNVFLKEKKWTLK